MWAKLVLIYYLNLSLFSRATQYSYGSHLIIVNHNITFMIERPRGIEAMTIHEPDFIIYSGSSLEGKTNPRNVTSDIPIVTPKFIPHPYEFVT